VTARLLDEVVVVAGIVATAAKSSNVCVE